MDDLFGRLAADLGVDRVSFAGQVWTSSAGVWSADASAGQDLKLHQEPAATK